MSEHESKDSNSGSFNSANEYSSLKPAEVKLTYHFGSESQKVSAPGVNTLGAAEENPTPQKPDIPRHDMPTGTEYMAPEALAETERMPDAKNWADLTPQERTLLYRTDRFNRILGLELMPKIYSHIDSPKEGQPRMLAGGESDKEAFDALFSGKLSERGYLLDHDGDETHLRPDTLLRFTLDPDTKREITEKAYQKFIAEQEMAKAVNEIGEELDTADPSRQLLDFISERGIEVPDKDQAEAILGNPNFINMKFPAILEVLGLDAQTAREMRNDGLLKLLNEIGQQRFSEYLKNIDFEARINPDNLAINAEYTTVGLDTEQACNEIKSILRDPEVGFHQGFGWNVLTSERSKYVLKFVKSNQDPQQTMRHEQEQFKAVSDVMGDKYLLPQVVMKVVDRTTPVMLQEKLHQDEWRGLGMLTPGIEADVRQAVAANPENRAILHEFLRDVHRLEAEEGLLIDFSGDNVVYRLDHNGRLEIKIPDYGLMDAHSPDQSDRRNRQNIHAELLRSLSL